LSEGECDPGPSPNYHQVIQNPTIVNKNPVSVLYEMKPTAKFTFMSESGDGLNKTFSFSVDVDGQIFTGSGKNKRLAKAHAAQNAVQSLCGITFFSSPGRQFDFFCRFETAVCSWIWMFVCCICKPINIYIY